MIIKHKNFTALRRAFPEIDRLAREVIDGAAARRRKAIQEEDQRPPSKTRKSSASVELLFEAISAAVPPALPSDIRNDIINDIWVAAKEGEIASKDLTSSVKRFITSHFKMFPTKFAKFGNARLLSLNATLSDESSMTRGDMVSEGCQRTHLFTPRATLEKAGRTEGFAYNHPRS